MAWFRHAVHTYPEATFIAKTDDDAFVQTIKLKRTCTHFSTHRECILALRFGVLISKTFEPWLAGWGPTCAQEA